MASEKKSLVIILGPTAVGKSRTALRLAGIFEGEVINCDSMQVYRKFDIGTDKLPEDMREGIPHHLIDIADPVKQFTAAAFVVKALEAIRLILDRNHLPLIAGGTGLYLKALLEGLFPEERKDPEIRLALEEEARTRGLELLMERLRAVDPDYAKTIGPRDRVRIIRALEVYTATQKPLSAHFRNTLSPLEDFKILKIGLELERQELYGRIERRVDRMFERGLVEEVRALIRSGIAAHSPPFRALGYKHVLGYLEGKTSLQEAVSMAKRDTRRYAKRQMTWFRKMQGIRWFPAQDFGSIEACVRDHLLT